MFFLKKKRGQPTYPNYIHLSLITGITIQQYIEHISFHVITGLFKEHFNYNQETNIHNSQCISNKLTTLKVIRQKGTEM